MTRFLLKTHTHTLTHVIDYITSNFSYCVLVVGSAAAAAADVSWQTDRTRWEEERHFFTTRQSLAVLTTKDNEYTSRVTCRAYETNQLKIPEREISGNHKKLFYFAVARRKCLTFLFWTYLTSIKGLCRFITSRCAKTIKKLRLFQIGNWFSKWQI